MKKLIFILAVIVAFSCSSDDSTPVQAQTYMRVYSLGTGSAPGGSVSYNITYGTGSESEYQVNTFVSEEVYNYYLEKQTAEHPVKTIWRGEISE
jgi:hypothetical protein